MLASRIFCGAAERRTDEWRSCAPHALDRLFVLGGVQTPRAGICESAVREDFDGEDCGRTNVSRWLRFLTGDVTSWRFVIIF
ncbi:hypothetical protein HPP92_020313 [Vanilla planifolia]|uniref:Uncharacterized protein n=1 Tax=Vanilla planifolia TaxID=51239 RepID=A0A835Q2J7_VANPL|nr:hypothetical protein HPP92_020313 [Vanilla planifolia]